MTTNKGLLCSLNGKLVVSKGKLCLACDKKDILVTIEWYHGYYAVTGKWQYSTLALQNGTYRVIYDSGAICFFATSDSSAWMAGNCFYMDGIVQDGASPGGSPLPGVFGDFSTAAAAEAAAKGSESMITITQNGISMYFYDTWADDNSGSITYRLTKIDDNNEY